MSNLNKSGLKTNNVTNTFRNLVRPRKHAMSSRAILKGRAPGFGGP